MTCYSQRRGHGSECGWSVPGVCKAPATHHVAWGTGCAHLCAKHMRQIRATARQRGEPITITPLAPRPRRGCGMKRYRKVPLNEHLIRYYPLGDYIQGVFIDRESSTLFREHYDHPYEVYLAGASPKGFAELLWTKRTLAEALDSVAVNGDAE